MLSISLTATVPTIPPEDCKQHPISPSPLLGVREKIFNSALLHVSFRAYYKCKISLVYGVSSFLNSFTPHPVGLLSLPLHQLSTWRLQGGYSPGNLQSASNKIIYFTNAS